MIELCYVNYSPIKPFFLKKKKKEEKAPDALNKNSVKHSENKTNKTKQYKKTSYSKLINNCSLGWKLCSPAPGLESIRYGLGPLQIPKFYLPLPVPLGNLRN